MTPAEIKNLQPGKNLRDSSVTGLEVRAFPSGKKAFYVWFRTKAGKPRHPKIGDCAVMSIAEARTAARALLLEVANGKDPTHQRRNDPNGRTVDQLWQVYREQHGQFKKSAGEDQRMYLRHIAPRFRNHLVHAFRYDDALRVSRALEDTPIQANRVISLLSRMFSFAERPLEWRSLATNPCRGVPRYPERQRLRYARHTELASLGSSLVRHLDENPAGVAFLYLLMFTGARPAEIGESRREWLDGNVLRLPDSKTGQGNVHLPPQAMDALARIPAPRDGSLLGIRKAPRRLWRKIRAEAGCPDLRMYPDLRRTFATVGIGAGVSLDQVGGLLKHKNRQTTLVYAKLMEDVANDAAAATANKMDELLGGSRNAHDQTRTD